MDVADKIIIVTGASSGIGLATSKLLASKGAKVVLVSRSENKLKNISKEIKDSLAIPADMTNSKEIKIMVEKTKKHFGRIDILINNAGRGYDAPIEKINIKTFHDIFELDLIGPLIAMQQVIPIMRSQGGGMIVNVSSGTALMNLPNMGAYSSLKKALVGISLTAREELEEENILVCVVYPYITLTDFEKNTIRESKRTEIGDMPFKPDPVEFVAQEILKGIERGDAEIFVHDWMKKLK